MKPQHESDSSIMRLWSKLLKKVAGDTHRASDQARLEPTSKKHDKDRIRKLYTTAIAIAAVCVVSLSFSGFGAKKNCAGIVVDNQSNPLHGVKITARTGEVTYTNAAGKFDFLAEDCGVQAFTTALNLATNGEFLSWTSSMQDATKKDPRAIIKIDTPSKQKLRYSDSFRGVFGVEEQVFNEPCPSLFKVPIILHKPIQPTQQEFEQLSEDLKQDGRIWTPHVLSRGLQSFFGELPRYKEEVRCLQRRLEELGFQSGDFRDCVRVWTDQGRRQTETGRCYNEARPRRSFTSSMNPPGEFGEDEERAVALFQTIQLTGGISYERGRIPSMPIPTTNELVPLGVVQSLTLVMLNNAIGFQVDNFTILDPGFCNNLHESLMNRCKARAERLHSEGIGRLWMGPLWREKVDEIDIDHECGTTNANELNENRTWGTPGLFDILYVADLRATDRIIKAREANPSNPRYERTVQSISTCIISLPTGGPWFLGNSFHRTHQTGTNADLRPFRSGAQRASSLVAPQPPADCANDNDNDNGQSQFDRDRTDVLIDVLLEDTRVRTVFFKCADPRGSPTDPHNQTVGPAPGHSDHLHIYALTLPPIGPRAFASMSTLTSFDGDFLDKTYGLQKKRLAASTVGSNTEQISVKHSASATRVLADLATDASCPEEATFVMPFNLFALQERNDAAKINMSISQTFGTCNAYKVIVEVKGEYRVLEIPFFKGARVILGDEGDLTKTAKFKAIYLAPKAFHIELSGSICLPATMLLKPTGQGLLPAPPLCRQNQNEVELQFGRRLNGEIGGEAEEAEDVLLPNAVLDFNTGNFLLLGINLPEVDLLRTGITISAKNIALDLFDFSNPWDTLTPIATADFEKVQKFYERSNLFDPTWQGLYIQEARLDIKALLGVSSFAAVTAYHLIIDHNGFTGVIHKDFDESVMLGGFSAKLKSIDITIVRNTFKEANIRADIAVFADLENPTASRFCESNCVLDVTFNLNLDGNWSVIVTPTDRSGFLKLAFPDKEGARVRLTFEKLRFGRESKGAPLVLSVDGYISLHDIGASIVRRAQDRPDPLKSTLELLGAGVQQLETQTVLPFSGFQITFGSPGKIGPPDGSGGWIDLKNQKEFSFPGFKFVLRKIGFGTLDGSPDITQKGWFGWAGSLNMGPEAANVSLNEMKFTWGADEGMVDIVDLSGGRKFRLDLGSISINIHWGNAAIIKGRLDWKPDQNCFRGEVSATFPNLKLSADAEMIMGRNKNENYRFWSFDADAKLPKGIPVASDIALYGFGGGLGQNVKFDSMPNPSGCRTRRWAPDNKSGGFVFRAGVNLGTHHDDGFSFNADVDLVIDPIGPVISLEGMAWILQERIKAQTEEKQEEEEEERSQESGSLTAVIRYDGRERPRGPGPLFWVNLTGSYKVVEDGITIVEFSGMFDLLFAPGRWHVDLGQKSVGSDAVNCPEKPLKDRRLSVEVLEGLLTARSYFMIGSDVPFPLTTGEECRSAVSLGIFADYGKDFDAEVVQVFFKLFASADLAISWKPKQILVAIALTGEAGFRLFGFGYSLGIDALARGQYPQPKELIARLALEVGLPWPLPDLEVEVELELVDDVKGKPKFPQPLSSFVLNLPNGNVEGVDSLEQETDPSDVSKTLPQTLPLNPRLVLRFSRPIDWRLGDWQVDGRVPEQSTTQGFHRPVSELSTEDREMKDRVGAFTIWYRLNSKENRGIRLQKVIKGEFDELDSCALWANVAKRLDFSTYWGKTPIWRDEARLMLQSTPIGKPAGATQATPERLVNEARRQLLSLNPGTVETSPLPVATPVLLDPDSWYRLWVITAYDLKEKDGPTETVGEIANIFCFRTGSTPDDLTPYVAWTNPATNAPNAFYREDLLLLFNTAGMQDLLYEGEPVRLVVLDQDGNEIGRNLFDVPLLNGQVLHISAKKLIGGPVGQEVDTFKPRRSYTVKLLGLVKVPLPDNRTIEQLRSLYQLQFTTSGFGSFEDLINDKQTKLGGRQIDEVSENRQLDMSRVALPVEVPSGFDHIVVTTPEPLPWTPEGRLKVTLCPGGQVSLNRDTGEISCTQPEIDLERLSSPTETIHVLLPGQIRADGKFERLASLPPGAYSLIVRYRGGLLPERIPSLAFVDPASLDPFLTKANKVIFFRKR